MASQVNSTKYLNIWRSYLPILLKTSTYPSETIPPQKIAEETDNDLMDLYIDVLEKASAKYEFLLVLPEAIEKLKQNFRAVKTLEYRDYNGKQMAVVKVFYGSSKFNTKEMSILIDKALQIASELGIVVELE